jgi:hypothetical protein
MRPFRARDPKRPHCSIAPGGFEPPFAAPKAAVLPLDEGAAEHPKLPAQRGLLNTCTITSRRLQGKTHSTSSTAATRVTVRVGTTVPGSAPASAAVSENSGTTPNSVDPEPLIPAIDAPAARSCAMIVAISG